MTNDSDELLLNNTFCRVHDQLLMRYQRALDAWATRRDEAWQMGLRGKELGGELSRLQNEFANSYAVLHKHRRECSLCQSVQRIAQSELAQSLPRASYWTQPK